MDCYTQQLQHVFNTEDKPHFINLADSCELEQDECLTQILKSVQNQGWYAASIDSVIEISKDTLQLKWFLGQTFQKINLQPQGLPDNVLKKWGKKGLQALKLTQFNQIKKETLSYYENQGFPFAEVKTNGFENGNPIKASLEVDKGEFVTIDSIYNDNDLRVSRHFLSNYLKIKKEAAYNESAIKAISQKIENLSFISEIRPPEIVFDNGNATVKTYLKKAKSNRFDLVIGVIPKADGNGIDITGDGEIELLNAFGYGEYYGLSYNSFQNKGKQFKSAVNIPYLPLIPIGIDFKFDIFIQDTLFRDINTHIALQYDLFTNGNIQFFYQNQRTALINVDVSKVLITKALPTNLDIANSYYGGKINFSNLDYRFNPRKGWEITFDAALGFKKITENVQITSLSDESLPEFDFASLYDSLDVKSIQIKSNYSISRFFKIGRGGALHTKFYGGIIKNLSSTNNPIFSNEQFRVGGYNSIRGFDEQSINADIFNVLSVEYRYILSKNSNAFLFFDAGNRINSIIDNQNFRVDYPYGFGLGANFETKAGIFGLTYALGAQLGNSILFRNGKVHFGYLNYF